MTNPTSGLRSFKGGAWDLRKVERRQVQQDIAFPDRRVENRRLTDKAEDDFSLSTTLTWIAPSDRDE